MTTQLEIEMMVRRLEARLCADRPYLPPPPRRNAWRFRRDDRRTRDHCGETPLVRPAI